MCGRPERAKTIILPTGQYQAVKQQEAHSHGGPPEESRPSSAGHSHGGPPEESIPSSAGHSHGGPPEESRPARARSKKKDQRAYTRKHETGQGLKSKLVTTCGLVN